MKIVRVKPSPITHDHIALARGPVHTRRTFGAGTPAPAAGVDAGCIAVVAIVADAGGEAAQVPVAPDAAWWTEAQVASRCRAVRGCWAGRLRSAAPAARPLPTAQQD